MRSLHHKFVWKGIDMKTIAVIESCDTKAEEAGYIKELIEQEGLSAVVIDVSTGCSRRRNYDIARETVCTDWISLTDKTKAEKVTAMRTAIRKYLKKLYDEHKISGVISVGGLQNTIMATEAMAALPIGFPKVMATTVACGQRKFEPFVQDKDIVIIPSIADFTGLNTVTRQIIKNAVACCVGMVKSAGHTLEKNDKKMIGVTLMGITNIGACAAIQELEKMGYECIGFHATGVGGPTMEKLAAQGLLDGLLDMNVHEITQEYYGGGFSYGKEIALRLRMSVSFKIPLVICPGGLDFVDFAPREFYADLKGRKYEMHNDEIAHIKLTKGEALKATEGFRKRLSAIDYPVRVLLPTDGMRSGTKKGEPLYDREVDQLLLDSIKNIPNANLRIIEIKGNMNTKEWGILAAKQMDETMKELAQRRS